jgi:ubiquinone/menaquinone biosynthesis C-methylase UbiE
MKMKQKQSVHETGGQGWFGYYNGKLFNQHLPSESMKYLSVFFKKYGVKTILDFACGTGRNTVYLAEKGFSMYGFDQFKEVVNETSQKLKERKLHARLKTLNMKHGLPYKNDFFDAVIIIRALYHAKIATINKIAKDIVRVVKPGGYIYIESWQKSDGGKTVFKKTEEKGTYKVGRAYYHIFTGNELKGLFPGCKLLEFSFKNKKFYMLVQKYKHPKP